MKRFYLTSLKMISVLFCTALAVSVHAEVFAVKEWRGEYFKSKEGAVYVRTMTSGFPKVTVANVQVTLFGILQQKSFTFSNSQTSADAAPRELWKFPSGKYRVERVEITDGAGVKRAWVGKSDAPMAILVPRIMISNLGVWTITPVGPTGLNIKFDMASNTYKENGPKNESSVAAVVNGFTGSVQQVIGGKKVIEGADNDYAANNEVRATSTFTRQIAMFYRVDLFKHNAYSKNVSAALNAFDQNLRTCYIRALDSNATLKGDLVFQVLVSAKTGTIRQARKSKGTIADGTMIDCLIGELQQIPMPIQENMIGEFTFSFEAK